MKVISKVNFSKGYFLRGGGGYFWVYTWLRRVIDYKETYAPVARLEAIRMLLAYASIMNFKLYQMDVKSAFLNGFIQEEVYVSL